MQEENKGTFFGGLLALLIGLPTIINAWLDSCQLGNSKLDALLKPVFWICMSFAILGWAVPFGIDGLNTLALSLSDSISGSYQYVTGLISNMVGGAVAPVEAVVAPEAVVTPLSDVPTTPGS